MEQQSDERPWGSWRVIDQGDGFKVKRIEVKPGGRLSYQTHEHRAEHWVVVVGRGTATIEGRTVVLEAGERVDIATGHAHRMHNDSDEPLVFIEVQRGSYTGEDDIQRLDDDYGR